MAGTVQFPAGVKFLVASFPVLFGSRYGQVLRAWYAIFARVTSPFPHIFCFMGQISLPQDPGGFFHTNIMTCWKRCSNG